MGKIEVFGKWDLEDKKWNYKPEILQCGRSFAFGNYEDIINSELEEINYIIIAYGSRVEDHSKDFINIEEKYIGVNKMISYFSRKNKNVSIKTFLMDADAPIIEDAKMLANIIDKLASDSKTGTINLVGLSKCANMMFYVPKYFNKLSSFHKTNVFTIAAPFDGTKMASPKIFYPEIKRFIVEKFGKNTISEMLYTKLINYYEGISSNSHMDYDIAMIGGIPEEKSDYYDEDFIKNIFLDDNILAISRVNSYHNFLTGIDDKTMMEAIRTGNITGVGLCLLDKYFFEEESDGLVMRRSQRRVEDKIDSDKINTHNLESSHHQVTSNDRVFKNILDVVDITMDEQIDKNKTLKMKKLS